MKPKPKATTMQRRPDCQLGPGVLALDPSHHPAADFRSHNIRHRVSPCLVLFGESEFALVA